MMHMIAGGFSRPLVEELLAVMREKFPGVEFVADEAGQTGYVIAKSGGPRYGTEEFGRIVGFADGWIARHNQAEREGA